MPVLIGLNVTIGQARYKFKFGLLYNACPEHQRLIPARLAKMIRSKTKGLSSGPRFSL